MKEILLLTLHKQHYMDAYDKTYKSKISCLGYYDEISIVEVKNVEPKNSLTSLKPKNSLLDIWYAIGDKNSELEGRYSNLNIVLFRDEGVHGKPFYWEKEEMLPFFGIGFIKFKADLQYEKLLEKSKEFESIVGNQVILENEEYCEIISYCTLDSADLVVLVKSNKMSLIKSVLFSIHKKVSYIHSIFGIDEAFLKDYNKEYKKNNAEKIETSFNKWKEIQCFLQEKIKSLSIRLVVDGNQKVLLQKEIIRYFTEKNITYSNIEIFYTFGHASLNIEIRDTNVQSLVIMLIEEGFLTHKNPLYNIGVYNIESFICMESENDISSNQLEDKTCDLTTNKEAITIKKECENKIKEYKSLIKNYEYQTDEAFYSYYQALLRTLNAVSQFEKFEMSKDLFYLLYPSLREFNRQLINLLTKCNLTENVKEMLLVKKSLCDYLEAVNSVIYHTIHTDQVYLMVPGYSGTSFSIPIKLSLFYMWFANEMITILNDSNRIYTCILIPVMESKPLTGEFKIDNNELNKMIYVKLSQRQLYFPRNLMIILTHELAHYVGKGLRNRKLRVEHIIRILAYCICEGMLPENGEKNAFITNNLIVWNEFVKDIKPRMIETVKNSIEIKFREYCIDEEYHSINIKEPLIKATIDSISEDSLGVYITSMIYDISNEIMKYIQEKPEEYSQRMRKVYDVQTFIDINRKQLISSKVIHNLVQELIDICKEIFSDIAGIEILNCSIDFYRESFFVSEGTLYGNDNTFNIIRQRIISKLYDKEITDNGLPFYYFENQSHIYLQKNLLVFLWTNRLLEDYAKECKNILMQRMKTVNISSQLTNIQESYKKIVQENSFSDIYREIIDKKNQYKESINKEYSSYIINGSG